MRRPYTVIETQPGEQKAFFPDVIDISKWGDRLWDSWDAVAYNDKKPWQSWFDELGVRVDSISGNKDY